MYVGNKLEKFKLKKTNFLKSIGPVSFESFPHFYMEQAEYYAQRTRNQSPFAD